MLSTSAHSKIHEFETTQLKSLGGAGVAGVFAEESAFLNPASLALLRIQSVYAQKDVDKLSANGIAQPAPRAMGFAMVDGNPEMSGSLSYVIQEEDLFKRKRWGLSLASAVSEVSSAGMSIRQSKDENTSTHTSIKYYQAVLGITHAIDQKLSIGIVAYDPFKSQGKETKALVGAQYILMEYVVGSLDFGGDYNSQEISKTLIYKAALQIKLLNDFYLRFGGFNDKLRSESGSGYGLSWAQPRLSLNVALKNTKRSKDINLNQAETNFKETSFAVSIKF